jgi:hypothetical protein
MHMMQITNTLQVSTLHIIISSRGQSRLQEAARGYRSCTRGVFLGGGVWLAALLQPSGNRGLWQAHRGDAHDLMYQYTIKVSTQHAGYTALTDSRNMQVESQVVTGNCLQDTS